MEARIISRAETSVVGMKKEMSLMHDQTFVLWNQFMSRRQEIKNNKNAELISMTEYRGGMSLQHFTPQTIFDKWACVEVNDNKELPEGFESKMLPETLYAVFTYRGKAEGAGNFFRKIFTEWLPNSGYQLGEGPHLAIMGEKYKGNVEDSEEEIFIPIVR